MKHLFFVLFFLFPGLTFGAGYIFFLHNRFFEEVGATGTSPEYGEASYHELVNVFRDSSFTVISELRKKDTDVKTYAQKVAGQIDSLLQRDVQANEITVIGTSKGSYIAMWVSTFLKNTEINFVFIGACSDQLKGTGINWYGNVLSVYEKTDAYGQSCKGVFDQSSGVKHYKEIVLDTGLKHGFLYRPMAEWVKPALVWARGNYN